MNSRFSIMLIIALILAGGAALIAKHWVDSQAGNQAVSAEQNMIKVYVAATNIPFATRIENTQLKLMSWPKDNLPPEAFTEEDIQKDPNAIIGKVTQRDFFTNEILLKPQIKDHLGGSTLSALIQEGMRAMSVRVNDVVGVAGFILPGNKADIIHFRNENETSTLLKNVKILAIDQIASTAQDKPAVVRALTLEVTPKDAEKLVSAMQTGSLQFTLRNPMDIDTYTEPTGVQPVNLPVKVKQAPTPISVKILPWTSQKFIECADEAC